MKSRKEIIPPPPPTPWPHSFDANKKNSYFFSNFDCSHFLCVWQISCDCVLFYFISILLLNNTQRHWVPVSASSSCNIKSVVSKSKQTVLGTFDWWIRVNASFFFNRHFLLLSLYLSHPLCIKYLCISLHAKSLSTVFAFHRWQSCKFLMSSRTELIFPLTLLNSLLLFHSNNNQMIIINVERFNRAFLLIIRFHPVLNDWEI